MILSNKKVAEFQQFILEKGNELYRQMPWREDCNPYYILLSEIMLQQTQVPRVLVKFQEFIDAFPTIESLANAEFFEVLSHWSGLGYNRRAKFLHEAVKALVKLQEFPKTPEELVVLPGIGPNTAASILVYAHNSPLVFIETNIRTVFIYMFFQDTSEKIDETILQKLVKQTLYIDNPRQWYWALMDYGFYIKKTEGNYNRLSKMHTTQSKFEGSNRQKRAQILRFLLQSGPSSKSLIADKLTIENELVNSLLQALLQDSLIIENNGLYLIA